MCFTCPFASPENACVEIQSSAQTHPEEGFLAGCLRARGPVTAARGTRHGIFLRRTGRRCSLRQRGGRSPVAPSKSGRGDKVTSQYQERARHKSQGCRTPRGRARSLRGRVPFCAWPACPGLPALMHQRPASALSLPRPRGCGGNGRLALTAFRIRFFTTQRRALPPGAATSPGTEFSDFRFFRCVPRSGAERPASPRFGRATRPHSGASPRFPRVCAVSRLVMWRLPVVF